MADCPHLDYKASHCRGCSGWFCVSKGRKKKISDPSMCKDEDERLECPRFLATLSATERDALAKTGEIPEKHEVHRVVRSTPKCPYRGPRPDGKCCGEHCYAVNAHLKLPHKTCKSGWLDCFRYWRGFEQGVPFYGSE